MKILASILLVALAAGARADMVITSKAEVDIYTYLVITKAKGDMIRADSWDKTATIYDLKNGTAIFLFPQEKKFMKLSLEELGKHASLLPDGKGKQTDKSWVPYQFAATGRKEKVGDCMAEIYTLTGPEVKYTYWVSKDFPNAAAFHEHNARVTKMLNDPHPDILKIEGALVKMTVEPSERQGRTLTLTLVSVKIEPVEDSVFEVPAGYTEKPVSEVFPEETAK